MPTSLSQLKQALNLFWKNRLTVALCGLVDIAFFIALAFAHYHVLKKLAGITQVILEELQKATMDVLTEQDMMNFRPALMKSASFVTAYHQIVKYMALLAVLVLLAWIVFKGINWYLANRIVKGKVELKSYAKQFVLYSLLWFAGLVIIILIMMSMMSYATTAVLPLIGKTGAYAITTFLILVLAYFAFISYSLMPKAKFKEIFIKGIKKWRQIVPAYLFSVILAFLAAYIPLKIALWQHPAAYWIVLAFALFISLPALSYGRIYISLIVNKAQNK